MDLYSSPLRIYSEFEFELSAVYLEAVTVMLSLCEDSAQLCSVGSGRQDRED